MHGEESHGDNGWIGACYFISGTNKHGGKIRVNDS